MTELMGKAIMKLSEIIALRKQSDTCPLDHLQAEYLIKLSEGHTMRIRRIESLLYIIIAMVILIGCAEITSDKGKITQESLIALQTKAHYYNDMYCSDANAPIRDALLAMIRDKFPNYPEKGLCGVEKDLSNMIKSAKTAP